MKNDFFLIIVILVIISIWSCNNLPERNKIVFEEKVGIARKLEFVTVSVANHHKRELFIKDMASGLIIRGEKLNSNNSIKDSSSYIFPVSMNAYEKKSFLVVSSTQKINLPIMNVTGEDLSVMVENNYFIANFERTDDNPKKGLHSGQLASILIKNNDVILKRNNINIHWSPNFKKDGFDYKTFAHLNSKYTKITQRNSYLFEIVKAGYVNNYEEIDLFGQYNFFAGLPYFIYASTMSFNKDVKLSLLRNDEMTMDSLFTHLVYPDSLGKMTEMSLYNTIKFDSLTKTPLAHDIGWLGFINKSNGYGLICIRLSYDNKNIQGKESPLYRPHTKISQSNGNGRYWNRRLIHEQNTLIPKGSMYYEQNAYLVIDNFDSIDNVDDQIRYYSMCLNNPITVSYLSE